MSMYLRRLPDELIVDIILQLPMVDILHCRTVSKHINSLIQTSSAIQYKTELAANGLVPCPASTLSAALSVRRLREQQDAWRRCEWKEEQTIKLQTGCRTYEFRNSIWAFGHCDISQESAHPPDYTTTITCFRLSSTTTGQNAAAEGNKWSLKDLEMSIRDFTMDPLIDLLALVEQTPDGSGCPFRIHIRRLSDGQPHEMAVNPILDFDMISAHPGGCSFGVQLQGAFIGVLVRQDEESGDYDTLSVWNWRTGSQELHMEAATCSFDDFAFIDTCSIIIAVLGHPVALQVWCFDTSHVYFAGSFALPLTSMENGYLEVHFDGGPSLSPAGAKTLDGTPFTLGPIPKVLAVSFGVIEPNCELQAAHHVAGFIMVMRPSLMLEVLQKRSHDDIEKLGRHSDEYVNRMTLEWEAWGPQCTRWIRQEPDHLNWEPCSVGGRLAIVTPVPSKPSEQDLPFPVRQVIRLYDFRPEIVSRYGYSFPEDMFCTEPGVIPKETMFVEDIISSLPYHVVTSKELPYSVSGVMIDEGRLICTKAEADDEWRTLIVLTF